MTHEERVNKAAQEFCSIAEEEGFFDDCGQWKSKKDSFRLYMKKLQINVYYDKGAGVVTVFVFMRLNNKKTNILKLKKINKAYPIEFYKKAINIIISSYPQIFDKYYLNKVIKRSDYSQERSKSL